MAIRRGRGFYVTHRLPVAVLGASAVAAVTPAPAVALVLALAAVALMAAIDARSAPDVDALAFSRNAPDVVTMGERRRVAVRLHNPTSRPLEVIIRDAAPPSARRDPPRHQTVIPAGGWQTFDADIRPTRRGILRLGPVTVRTAGRLRLAGRQSALASWFEVKVYPPLPGRAEVELRLERARLLQIGERSSSVRGGGTDFDSLREYHPDDEFRRINWRATARAPRPITNLFREERNQHVILLLDAGRTMAATVAGISRFEHALDAGFAVAELASRIGDHVGVLAFAADVMALVGPKGGRGQPRRILATLFALEPRLEAPNYREAFSSLLTRHRRRSLLVLLTELVDEAAMESLFEALPVLISRHIVMVGSVVDSDVETFAMRTATSSEDAYLKAAAAGSLAARDRTAARLRRMGVLVVDRPPGRLAGELADQYLRLKAFGRL